MYPHQSDFLHVKGEFSDTKHLFLPRVDSGAQCNFPIAVVNRLIKISIIFENKLKKDLSQNVAVINFTDTTKYTRVTKWNCLPNCKTINSKDCTYTYEIPCSIEDNPGEYYYPIHTDKSKIMYMK